MVFDLAFVLIILLSLALGHFLGVWRHLGVVVAMVAGYALTPLWVTHSIPRVSDVTGWPPLFSAVACVATGILLPGIVAAVALRNVGAPPEHASTLSLVLEGFAGSLSWGTGALVLGVGLLGAFALQEPDALLTSDRLSFPLRSSRAYEEAIRFGLLRPGTPTLQRTSSPGLESAAPASVRIDDAAMKRDPRLRAALADPVVRHAMESGDYRELERRNHALRPLTPPKPEGKAGSSASDPNDPSVIDPRDLR